MTEFEEMMAERKKLYSLDTPEKLIQYLDFCKDRQAHAGLTPDDCKILVTHFVFLMETISVLRQALSEVED